MSVICESQTVVGLQGGAFRASTLLSNNRGEQVPRKRKKNTTSCMIMARESTQYIMPSYTTRVDFNIPKQSYNVQKKDNWNMFLL